MSLGGRGILGRDPGTPVTWVPGCIPRLGCIEGSAFWGVRARGRGESWACGRCVGGRVVSAAVRPHFLSLESLVLLVFASVAGCCCVFTASHAS